MISPKERKYTDLALASIPLWLLLVYINFASISENVKSFLPHTDIFISRHLGKFKKLEKKSTKNVQFPCYLVRNVFQFLTMKPNKMPILIKIYLYLIPNRG